MKRYLLILMAVLTLGNVTLAAVYACECTGKGGAKCSGTYCRTLADGNCECQDKPFGTAAELESGDY
jgi:hypothetical protein